jgi:hypothetical protein
VRAWRGKLVRVEAQHMQLQPFSLGFRNIGWQLEALYSVIEALEWTGVSSISNIVLHSKERRY